MEYDYYCTFCNTMFSATSASYCPNCCTGMENICSGSYREGMSDEEILENTCEIDKHLLDE